jgi:hypothetical protein
VLTSLVLDTNDNGAYDAGVDTVYAAGANDPLLQRTPRSPCSCSRPFPRERAMASAARSVSRPRQRPAPGRQARALPARAKAAATP